MIKENLVGYEPLIDVLDGMLKEDPKKRWNFKEILKFYSEKEFKTQIPIDEAEYAHKYQVEFKEKNMQNTLV